MAIKYSNYIDNMVSEVQVTIIFREKPNDKFRCPTLMIWLLI